MMAGAFFLMPDFRTFEALYQLFSILTQIYLLEILSKVCKIGKNWNTKETILFG